MFAIGPLMSQRTIEDFRLLVSHVNFDGAGQGAQFVVRRAEHGGRVTGRSPDLGVLLEGPIEIGRDWMGVIQRRDSPDDLARVFANVVGTRPPEPGHADVGCDLARGHSVGAAGEDQDRTVIASEEQAVGDRADLAAKGLRGQRSSVDRFRHDDDSTRAAGGKPGRAEPRDGLVLSRLWHAWT